MAPPTKTNKDRFQKKKPRDHVLIRPDMYIGSVENKNIKEFICLHGKIISKTISFNDGLARIGLEPIYNTLDNFMRCKGTSHPQKSVIIEMDDSSMSIYNDGAGVPVEESEKPGILIPELVFGSVLAGSNFDDEEQRDGIGGRNGVGIKASNIFSKRFTLETFDPNTGKLFTKTWTNNMVDSTPAIIKSKKGSKGYTKVSFEPDFARFGVDGFSEDMIAFFERVCYDLSLSTSSTGVPGITVTFNSKPIKVRSMDHYSTFFYLGKRPTVKFEGKNSTLLIVDCNDKIVNKRTKLKEDESTVEDIIAIEDDDPAMEVVEAFSPRADERDEVPDSENDKDSELYLALKTAIDNSRGSVISLVNGIYTRRGGAHVDEWMDKVLPMVATKLKKRFPTITAKKIQKKLMFFISAQLVNPTFDTQSKDFLTKPKPDVPKYKVEDLLIGKVARLPFVTHLKDDFMEEDRKEQSKTDAKKDSHKKVPKAINANKAKPGSSRCTLILTEGDSAAGMAMKALEVLPGGYDNYGIFPLRGKLLNTRNRSAKDINGNTEIQAIKNLVGLHHGVDYSDDENFDKLNYKRIWIMTDQDYDGDHIRGLILNYFAYTYTSLLSRDDFAVSIITPIMKVMLKDKQKTELTFYDLEKARQWLLNNKDVPHHVPKYFKGLGTLNHEDAIEYFSDPKTVKYEYEEDRDGGTVSLFFDKRRADDRKVWLRASRMEELPYKIEEIGSISVTDFVNYELKRYALRSNQRMIPSVMDGLKECQRKVLFATIKRNLATTKIKVVQLGGYIAEHTAYLHGEQNLSDTIIKMALSYVGTNNAPLLVDDGMFGTYFFGGTDAAAGRYIYTKQSVLARKLYCPDDDALLRYLEEEDLSIEPEWYLPILPVILINGCRAGIGTGYSSSVANYNPKDVAEAVIKWLESDNPDAEDYTLTPWYLGFNGEINLLKGSEDQVIGFETKGTVRQVGKDINVTELPVPLNRSGKFPYLYLEMLKDMMSKKLVKNVTHACTSYTGNFTITPGDKMPADKDLCLTSKDTTTNMVLLDKEGNPRRFKNTSDVIKYWAPIRLEFYERRKRYMLAKLKAQIQEIKNRIRFIKMVNDGDINLRNRKRVELDAELEKKDFDKDDESYDYLLNMHIASLTSERVEKLLHELKKREQDYIKLKKTGIKDMWKSDIQSFLDTYKNVFLKDLEDKLNKAKAQKLKATTRDELLKQRKTRAKK